ncbi:MAG: excinuclease ABC subunit C [Acidobacteriota bacterium]|nr:excinuclease ABC subunit C [Acidobacteriota bacterium]
MQSVPFDPADAKTALSHLPRRPAVFALYGADAHAEPYVGRTPNLRGRLERLLQPSAKHPRRLQLAGLVRRIEYRLTGSEFESLLLQFNLLREIYGTKCLERMHLRAPAFVRYLGSNAYPRITVTNRPSQREADWAYGPFASRAAAERFADEALKLFLLRRCTDDLNPDPSHPGCVYSEMKMCLAPCYQGCTDERYAEESAAVERFIATRGESKLVTLRAEREKASEELEFEHAAALHAQVQKVEAVRALAPELVQPMSQLRAVILQPPAPPAVGPAAPSAPAIDVPVFLFEHGRLRGPVGFSTLGMRIQNERSGSSSLFAQPISVEAVPETPTNSDPKPQRGLLEARMESVLEELARETDAPDAVVRQGHLALLKRWYYRPEVKRDGEIFFADEDGRWPVKALLRGVGRVAAKAMMGGAETKQDAQPERAE